MELITILNRCHRFNGFVYQHARFSPDKKSIEVAVRPRKGSAALCSRCRRPAPGYDQLAERRFEFIPLWGFFFVFLLYSMRRVDCGRCATVVVEEVPWGDGKRTLTKAYMLFLARWARHLSWKETAEAFRTSWEKVFDAVEHVVTFGLEHRVLGQIDAIGVDEIQYAQGHKYLTLVYQIDFDITRLLWVGRERTIESFQGFFTVIGEEVASKIVFVCSDMWEPYLKVIREKCSDALHILDRFHIVAKMNKALDEIRAGESRRMAGEGLTPVLKKSRWLLLKREENLKVEQRFRLRDLLRYNLKTVRAYLLKEAFQQFWDYNAPAWAGKFLDEWCRQVMRSRIEPMKKIARSLRQHRELILNYFRAQKLPFQRRCRGPEQQSQSHHEKILRLPYLPLPRTRTVSLTWQAAGARIYPRILLTNHILQSSAFWYAPGPGLADETASFAFDASPGVAAGSSTYADLEGEVLKPGLQAVLLRYGFFYGPGTWFSREGDFGEQVRRREAPVVGKGEGIWNWVHIEDAAAATCAAVTGDAGVYNVVNDQPVAQFVWLPAFARFIGAPEPPFVSEEQAAQSSGPDSVYYATRLRGASNNRAKAHLAFRPRPLEWLDAQQRSAM